MNEAQCEIGMVGLGVMGRNLLLNIAERGYAVAGFDKDSAQLARLQEEAGELPVVPCSDLARLLAVLRRPRAVLRRVPAAPPVGVRRDNGISLPPKAKLHFQVHYTANGQALTDVTRMGLYFMKDAPKYNYRSLVFFNLKLKIPPNTKWHVETAERTFDLVHRRYEEGVASQIEFLDARTQLTNAELNRALTAHRYAIRYFDLERAAALRPMD